MLSWIFGYDLTGSTEATGRLVKEVEEELDGAVGSVALICSRYSEK